MDKIISAGALIGWPYLIFDAECHWQKRIDRAAIKYFRSFDCENLTGEFDPLDGLACVTVPTMRPPAKILSMGLEQYRKSLSAKRRTLLDRYHVTTR